MGFAKNCDAPKNAGKGHNISNLTGKKRSGNSNTGNKGGIGGGIDYRQRHNRCCDQAVGDIQHKHIVCGDSNWCQNNGRKQAGAASQPDRPDIISATFG